MPNNVLGTRARPENEFYIATLAQPDTGFNFRGWVPDSFSLNIANSWEPILGSINEISSGATKAAQVFGVVPNLKSLTRQAWTGTGPIDFHMMFMLDTYKDAYTDVQMPINDLIKMATPKRNGALLSSPGPTILSDKNRIYLRIGKMLLLDSVVITDIDITYYAVSDVRGQYQSADINLGLRTHYTPDQDDVLKMFSAARENALSNNALFNQSPIGGITDFAKNAAVEIGNAYSGLVGQNTAQDNSQANNFQLQGP